MIDNICPTLFPKKLTLVAQIHTLFKMFNLAKMYNQMFLDRSLSKLSNLAKLILYLLHMRITITVSIIIISKNR